MLNERNVEITLLIVAIFNFFCGTLKEPEEQDKFRMSQTMFDSNLILIFGVYYLLSLI